jgi:hemerythrin superfamily protein
MPRTERSAKRTTDHEEIRRWVESHGGHPAAVKRTGRGDDPGILRIDFPGFSGQGTLEAIDWDTFFEWFDKNELAFLHQDAPNSRFNKLVSRGRSSSRERSSARAGSERRTSAAGKGSGEGKSATERESPPRHALNAIRVLEQQHRQVETLFDELDEGKGSKQQLFEEIADSLAAHSEIEERIFYPTVLGQRTEKELRDAVEEHLAVKRIIADLLKMQPDDPQFDGKMDLMRELVEHHVEEEEHRLFKEVERLDPAALDTLGDMMVTAFDDLMAQHPRNMVPKQIGQAAPLPPS